MCPSSNAVRGRFCLVSKTSMGTRGYMGHPSSVNFYPPFIGEGASVTVKSTAAVSMSL